MITSKNIFTSYVTIASYETRTSPYSTFKYKREVQFYNPFFLKTSRPWEPQKYGMLIYANL